MTYKHISATGSGSLAAQFAHASLVAVNVNTGAASAVLTLYDGTSTSGTVIATIDASAARSFWFGGVRSPGGLFWQLAGGNADITITFE